MPDTKVLCSMDEEAERCLPGPGVKRSGPARLASMALLLSAFAFVYADTAVSVAREWLGPTVSYGFVIFLVSLFMVWKRWGVVRNVCRKPAVLRGVLLTSAGCLLLIAGKAGGTLLLQEVSLLMTLMGIILTVYGPELLRVLALPVAYLVFMFPFIPELLADYSIYFQLSSASVASSALALAGMPVAREGQLIYLPHIALDVVKDCSGVHSIVTLVALSLPMVYFSRKSRTAKTALVVSAFFIGIIANGLRIALIGMWTKYVPDADIHGPSNLLLVSIFIVGFGLTALLLLSRLLPDRGYDAERKKREDSAPGHGKRSSVYPVVAACLVLVIAGMYAHSVRIKPFYALKNVKDLPLVIGDWKGEEAFGLEGPFAGAGPDASVKRIYHDGQGNTAGLYVAYFAEQSNGSKVFGYRYGLTNESSGESSLKLSQPNAPTINKTSFNTSKGRTDAYYWYMIDGGVLSGRYQAQLSLMRNAILYGRNNAAIVIVTREEGDPVGFIKAVTQALKPYVS